MDGLRVRRIAGLPSGGSKSVPSGVLLNLLSEVSRLPRWWRRASTIGQRSKSPTDFIGFFGLKFPNALRQKRTSNRTTAIDEPLKAEPNRFGTTCHDARCDKFIDGRCQSVVDTCDELCHHAS